MPTLKLPSLPTLKLGRAGADIVGLDIQPGMIAAVKARVNGSVLAERAAVLPLGGDTVRAGEVVDQGALTDALRELFSDSKLSKRVRVGIANQKTTMRTLELPPVGDQKELASAVQFLAQDQLPMPLSNAVLDFHALGVVETPAGPRQRIVLVAAQRDMVERLLTAVRAAGLTTAGVDLSAFALIRSLHQLPDDQSGRVLYLNVDGLTNLAIAEGTVCRFTRVIGGGLESMAAEIAERRGVAVSEARALLNAIDLSKPPVEHATAEPAVEAEPVAEAVAEPEEAKPHSPLTFEEHEAREKAMGYSETVAAAQAAAPKAAPVIAASDADVRGVLENGIHEIAGEVRNSLDFHRSQDGGGHVSHIILSGAALDLSGFAGALQTALGVEVHSEAVGLVDGGLEGEVSTSRLSVAAGLATLEAPQ
jgi:type IV pilus assembly protein PilM